MSAAAEPKRTHLYSVSGDLVTDRTEDLFIDNVAHPRLPAELTVGMSQLFSAGFSLLPLGGSDGKTPIVEFRDRKRLPLALVVERMAAAGSTTYGIRLGGLLVVDVDTDTPEARAYVEQRFAPSNIKTRTARGFHLYYQLQEGKAPKAVRLPGISIDFKTGTNSFVVGPHSIRPDGTAYIGEGRLIAPDVLPVFLDHDEDESEREDETTGGLYREGGRHTALKREAHKLALTAASCEELKFQLCLFRDAAVERPEDFDDARMTAMAAWFWDKKERGELWGSDCSTFSLSRQAVAYLLEKGEFVALALHLFLLANHGHKPNATFSIVPAAIIRSKRLKAGRRQIYAAIRCLLELKLLTKCQVRAGPRQPHNYKLGKGIWGERGGEGSSLTLVSSEDTQKPLSQKKEAA